MCLFTEFLQFPSVHDKNRNLSVSYWEELKVLVQFYIFKSVCAGMCKITAELPRVKDENVNLQNYRIEIIVIKKNRK